MQNGYTSIRKSVEGPTKKVGIMIRLLDIQNKNTYYGSEFSASYPRLRTTG